MATTGRKQVSPGQTIQSAEWGNVLWDQSIQCFDTTADRDTQFPGASVHEGAMCFTNDTKTLWEYKNGAWAVVLGAGLIGTRSVLDGAGRTATTFAAATDLCAISVTAIAGRRYRLRGWIDSIAATFSAGNGIAFVGLAFNGVQMGNLGNVRSGVTGVGVSAFAEYVGTLAVATANAAVRVFCGASVTSVLANNVQLTVEDLG